MQALENLRIEGEAAYRKSHIDDVKVTYSNVFGLGVDGGEGDIKCLSLMVNTWYDHFFGERLSFYLGGGIGAARVSVKDFSINTYPIVPSPTITKRDLIDNTDWRLAYQAGIGLGYKLNETFVIDLGYRYFATSDPELSDVERNDIKMDNSHDSFLLSIRYNF